eukprot:tig00021312_g20053.t1
MSIAARLAVRSLACVRARPAVRHVHGVAAAAAAAPQPLVRHDWTHDEIKEIFHAPLLELVFRAATIHRQFHDPRKVQQCTLLSIKTGGCEEDCAYCPQAARYNTDVKAEKLMAVESVMEAARAAKEAGSTRFCMGTAWREVKGKWQFKQICDMISGIRAMDMEVCATLGLLSEEQARALKAAGLTAYNHNLDTSPEYYGKIITTRKYEDRLRTLEAVRDAGISVCCGGILGLGEEADDRIGLLKVLATMPQHPESVPVNALVAVEGTPLEDKDEVPVWDLARMIATARILMPKSMIRLSAGRINYTVGEQALCFMAGANSIFYGDKLLTTGNQSFEQDREMRRILGLEGLEPFAYEQAAADAADAPASSEGCGKKGGCGCASSSSPSSAPQQGEPSVALA